jgi:hypothetical protein
MDREAIRQEVMQSLLWMKREYEGHFQRAGKMPLNRSLYAYLRILGLLLELAETASPARKDPGEMQRRAKEILEAEYGIVRA